MSARKKMGIYIHELFTSAISSWRKYINANVHCKKLQMRNGCFSADKLDWLALVIVTYCFAINNITSENKM